MKIAVYRISDGFILRRVIGPASQMHCQCGDGEEFFLNCPDDATHVRDGVPITIIQSSPLDEILLEIRGRRNRLLAASDYTQLEDYPGTAENKKAWKQYRKELRDFPSVCDPQNPVWPVAPE